MSKKWNLIKCEKCGKLSTKTLVDIRGSRKYILCLNCAEGIDNTK